MGNIDILIRVKLGDFSVDIEKVKARIGNETGFNYLKHFWTLQQDILFNRLNDENILFRKRLYFKVGPIETLSKSVRQIGYEFSIFFKNFTIEEEVAAIARVCNSLVTFIVKKY